MTIQYGYGQAIMQAKALRATWPAGEVLSALPKTLIVRVCRHDWVYGEKWDFPQSAGGISSSFVATPEDIKLHYNRISITINGQWHFLIPENRSSWRIVDTSLAGYAYLGLESFNYNLNSVVVLDWEDVPESVFERDFIGHIDAPLTPVVDNMPPRPNPPVFHIDAQVYFKFIKPYGVGKIPEDPSEWIYNTAYLEEDYILDPITLKMIDGGEVYELYKAKQNIVNKTTYPSENPEEWEWVPFWFELRIKADCCLCTDDEGNDNPIKYKMICAEDEDLNRDWSAQREADVLVGDNILLPSPVALTGTSYNPPGTTKTRIYYAGSFAVDDIVMMKYTSIEGAYIDGIFTVVGVGSDVGGTYFEVDRGFYVEQYFCDYAVAYNLTEIYDVGDWNSEACKDYQFAFQAKDSASPQNNLTKIGRYKDVVEPEEYPAEIIEELF